MQALRESRTCFALSFSRRFRRLRACMARVMALRSAALAVGYSTCRMSCTSHALAWPPAVTFATRYAACAWAALPPHHLPILLTGMRMSSHADAKLAATAGVPGTRDLDSWFGDRAEEDMVGRACRDRMPCRFVSTVWKRLVARCVRRPPPRCRNACAAQGRARSCSTSDADQKVLACDASMLCEGVNTSTHAPHASSTAFGSRAEHHCQPMLVAMSAACLSTAQKASL